MTDEQHTAGRPPTKQSWRAPHNQPWDTRPEPANTLSNTKDTMEPLPHDSTPAPTLEERLADAERRAAAAEHELRAVRDRYDAFVAAVAHITWTTSPEGLVDDVPFWRAYTGQTPEQTRGWGWLDALHPHDRAHTIAAWQQALRMQTMYEAEYRIRRADGVYHTFLARAVPVVAPDSTVREWVGYSIDVERHKQTERELSTHLGDVDQLRALVTRFSGEDVQPLLASVLNAVVEVQHAMAGVLMLYDAEREELTTAASTGFSDEYLALVGRVPKGAGACGRAVAENRPILIEDVRENAGFTPYLPAADLAAYRAVYTIPLRTTDGSILGTLATYFRTPHRPSRRETALVDLYAHHAALLIEQARLVAETRHASAEAAMQASRLNSIFETITDAIFVYDTDGRILLANAGARRMFDMDAHPHYASLPMRERNQILSPTDLDGTPLPGDRARPITRALRGETIDSEHAEEMLVHLPGGRGLTVSLSCAPVCGPDGAIVGAVVVLRDVSERHRLEREAHLRANQLEAMFGAMTDGALLMDHNGRITYLNAAALRFLGATPEEAREYFNVPPEDLISRFDPRDAHGRLLAREELPPFRALQGEALAGSTLQVLQLRVPTGPWVGQRRYWAFSGAPIHGEDGTILGAVILVRDVTEQIGLRNEVGLRAAELETILDTMPDAVSVLDRAGNIVRMNRAYRALFAPEEHADYFATPHKERAAMRHLVDEHKRPLAPAERPSSRALRGEIMTDASSLDVWLRLPWGRELNVNISGAPTRDADGDITGAVLVTHDVSERHKLMEHTRTSLAALLAMAEAMVSGERGKPAEAAEVFGLPVNALAQRLALLAKQVLGCERVGIVSLDERDHMTPIAATGLTEEQIPHWWQGLAGESIEYYIGPERLARLRVGEQVLLPLDSGPLSAIAYGGPMSLATPLLVGGQLVGSMAVDYDIEAHEYTLEERTMARAVARLAALVVERERLEREHAQAQAESLALRETNRRMEEFLSVAGHELKTPVTVIKANSQMLARWSARHGGLNPREAEMLGRTERQVTRLMRLVNDLLDATRIREGRLDLRRAPCDLAAITREAVEEQRELNPARTIALDMPSAPVLLTADADRVAQVVTNYLTNALKYSEERQPVEVTLTLEADRARVAVRDHGPGIPPDEIATIWEVFRRVPGVHVLSGSGVGLGLGLHISREIIERHGGTVGVESARGQGSTFWFTLPLGTPEVSGA